MATALARRTSNTKTKAKTSSARPPVRRRAAQVVQIVKSKAGAAARRASQSTNTKNILIGCTSAALTGAVIHKLPIPASVTNTVPAAGLVGAAVVIGSLALKGKARALVSAIGAGPLYAGAFQVGQKAGATLLAGEFDDVGYAPIQGDSGVAVEGEFEDLRH
jgi:hypothetical protein